MYCILNTPLRRLTADVACWTALLVLLVYAALSVSNPIVTGVLLTIAIAVGTFAVVYNGKNTRTVVRSYISRKRYEREAAEREAEYEAERKRQEERDAAYGRELRELNRRYNID